jgi:hypothetical protein
LPPLVETTGEDQQIRRLQLHLDIVRQQIGRANGFPQRVDAVAGLNVSVREFVSRFRETRILLNGVPVLDDRGIVVAFTDVRIAALDVLTFEPFGIARSSESWGHREREPEDAKAK